MFSQTNELNDNPYLFDCNGSHKPASTNYFKHFEIEQVHALSKRQKQQQQCESVGGKTHFRVEDTLFALNVNE